MQRISPLRVDITNLERELALKLFKIPSMTLSQRSSWRDSFKVSNKTYKNVKKKFMRTLMFDVDSYK